MAVQYALEEAIARIAVLEETLKVAEENEKVYAELLLADSLTAKLMRRAVSRELAELHVQK